MNSNICRAICVGAGLIFASLPAHARPTGVLFRHCDRLGELAEAIMIMRQSGAAIETTYADLYQMLVDEDIYEGDDYEFIHGTVRNAYQWKRVPDDQKADILAKFARAVSGVCAEMANGTWQPESTDPGVGKAP